LSDKSFIDITQGFTSVTIPPIIKTVVRNGHTLVYRVQDASMDQEIASAAQVQHASSTSAPKKSKTLVRRVTGDSSSTSYPSMMSQPLEAEDVECK
jgi:hypothetical protein